MRPVGSIEHITELLEQLLDEELDEERNELGGCRDAIDKATAILSTRASSVSRSEWTRQCTPSAGRSQRLAAALTSGNARSTTCPMARPSRSAPLKSFPGIDDSVGTFRAHLELAGLAVALKRRVVVLQAVEHAQIDPGNPFENFSRALKADQRRLEKLESSIVGVLVRSVESRAWQGDKGFRSARIHV